MRASWIILGITAIVFNFYNAIVYQSIFNLLLAIIFIILTAVNLLWKAKDE